MIRTARLLVTLFVFTLVFDIAVHAAGRHSLAPASQAPTDPQDDRRQPAQPLKAMVRLSDDAHRTGPESRETETGGQVSKAVSAGRAKAFLAIRHLSGPEFRHFLRTCGAESSHWQCFADYAIKRFGKRRVVKIRYNAGPAVRVA